MKALKLALIGGIAAAAVAGFASAASAETTVSYNVGIATDYVFRGIDQSPGSGTTGEVFGGVDIANGPIYAGAWLSNAGPSNAQGAELDLYAGYKLPLGGATLDLGLISYNYSHGSIYTAGSFISDEYNNWEAKAAISVPVGGATLGAAVYWTPDFGGFGESGTYFEANGAYTFANKATLSGAFGRQEVSGVPGFDGYNTWNLGVSYPLTEKLSIDARYIDSDSDGPRQGFAVGTLKLAF